MVWLRNGRTSGRGEGGRLSKFKGFLEQAEYSGSGWVIHGVGQLVEVKKVIAIHLIAADSLLHLIGTKALFSKDMQDSPSSGLFCECWIVEVERA